MRIIIFLFIYLFMFVDVYAADDASAPIYLHDYKEADEVRQELTKPEPPEDSTEKKKKPIYLHDYDYESKSPVEPSMSFRVNLGSFSPAHNSGSGGHGIGFEIDIKPKESISYRVELLILNREYEMSPPGGDYETLETVGLLFGVKASYPKDRAYRFHATGGVGFFKSELNPPSQLFPNWSGENDEDSGLGFHAGVGVEMGSEDYVVGLEYRHLTLDASFSKFGVRSEDIGGDWIGLSLGRFFY